MFVDERMEFALRHHRIGEVQTVELDLPRTVVVQVVCRTVAFLQEVDELVVERTVGNELQRADRVSDTFEVVALAVCEVVHRIAVPLCPRAVMRNLDDAVHDRVTEVHIRIGHVELRAQHHASLCRFGSVHLVEECEVLLHRTVTVR